MMVNKPGAVVCCVCLVSAVLAEISLRVKAAEGKAAGEGGVYFVPQHLHPGALLRSSTYFTATHMLGHD